MYDTSLLKCVQSSHSYCRQRSEVAELPRFSKDSSHLISTFDAILQRPQLSLNAIFSNSLFIYHVETKEIRTVTVVWKCDPVINIGFYDFISSKF